VRFKDASDVAVSRTGARLAMQELTNVNVWRLDLLASPRRQKLVVSSREQEAPSISPDARKSPLNPTGPVPGKYGSATPAVRTTAESRGCHGYVVISLVYS